MFGKNGFRFSATNEQFLSKVKFREFSGETQHSPLPAFVPVMLALIALLAVSSLLVLPQQLSKDQVTSQILRWLRASGYRIISIIQNTRKKRKAKIAKVPNSSFLSRYSVTKLSASESNCSKQSLKPVKQLTRPPWPSLVEILVFQFRQSNVERSTWNF